MNKRVYLSPPHLSGKELDYVHAAFAANWIAPVGPDINAFEAEMCAATGAAHALALSSGTAAIHLALILAGVKAGDEVLCSSFTFGGSAFPITYLGATPVFVDSDAFSWNMDPSLLEKAIVERLALGKKPVACIVVHLYGGPADLDPILDICKRHSVTVIEDAAESLGALYKNRHTGTLAPLGVFSFNGNKVITTGGGGMLVGRDVGLIDRARFLATQARDAAPHYEHTCIGFNYRMGNVGAAIGRGQLLTLTERVARKRAIFEFYRNHLGNLAGVDFMPEPEWAVGNRWLTCITVDPRQAGVERDAIRLALEHENIECRPLWKPMHLQPVFKSCPAFVNGVSERLFDTGLCLPSGTGMAQEDLERVAGIVAKMLRR
jgi:dTDP-4-amino-4,6-dideoxygalactose transaminase